jgi:hypothetical protein
MLIIIHKMKEKDDRSKRILRKKLANLIESVDKIIEYM